MAVMMFLGGFFHPFVGFWTFIHQFISCDMSPCLSREIDSHRDRLAIVGPGGERAGGNPNDRVAALDVLAARDYRPGTDDGVMVDNDRRDHHGAAPMRTLSPIWVSFLRLPSKLAVIVPAPTFTSRPTEALPR